MESLLKKLVETSSISGYEENIRDLMKKELKPYVDEMRTDKVGNLITRKGKGKPVVMLAAHMDELGLIVKYIEKDGFVKFDTVGGWDEKILLAEKVNIHTAKGRVTGVIGTRPIHLQEMDEKKAVVKVKDMYIDVGAKDKKEAEKLGISTGDFITQHGEFTKLTGSRVTGYGLDNRVGCLILIEVMKQLKGFKGTVYGVGSVQEELGLVGIRGPTYGINPDVALAIDTDIAGDTPDVKMVESLPKLGGGPSLDLKDAVSVVNPQVRKWVSETAKKNKIPLQYNIISCGATDASVVPTIREGIPAGSITAPTRYIHTPVEVADMKDIENVVKLVVASVKSAGKYF